MLFRVNWTITGANRNEVTRRFLAAESDSNFDLPEGVTMKGRWHNPVDLKGRRFSRPMTKSSCISG